MSQLQITDVWDHAPSEERKLSIGFNLTMRYFANMAVEAEKQTRRWTYEDYCRLDDDKRYEIIDGELLMAAAPDTWHQDWSRKLFRLVDQFVMAKKLGEVFYSPLDVVLDFENTVQPDLVFVANANLSIIQQPAIFGVPDLLVELVSPSSVRRDRYKKRDLYARFGVREYWIGDPANKALEILTFKSGRYELHCCVEEKGKLTSAVLAGLEFDLSEIL